MNMKREGGIINASLDQMAVPLTGMREEDVKFGVKEHVFRFGAENTLEQDGERKRAEDMERTSEPSSFNKFGCDVEKRDGMGSEGSEKLGKGFVSVVTLLLIL